MNCAHICFTPIFSSFIFPSHTLTNPTHSVSALESVHEDALQVLGEKLGQVEKHLLDKQDADGLMHQIASKFTLLESRLQSQLNDRVSHSESKQPEASDLHSRLLHLESKTSSHSVLSDRMSRLEAQLRPDPEHGRIITRINAKLDTMENAQRPAPAENNELRFFQDRIDKLTAMRARYASEEKELMG